MATIVTRDGKGSALTWAEADANFTNLNTDKLEDTDLASLTVNITTTGTVTATGATVNGDTTITGDYRVLGPESVTNGTFDADTDWTKLNATISGGQVDLSNSGSSSYVYQDGGITIGQAYYYSYEVLSVSAIGVNGVRLRVGNQGYTSWQTAPGTYEGVFVATGAVGRVQVDCGQDFVGSVDNVSVKEIALFANLTDGVYATDTNIVGDTTITGGLLAAQSDAGTNAFAAGASAGLTTQGNYAVAVGDQAGETTQGSYAVAIGYQAGEIGQGANGIIISSKGSAVNDTTAGHIHLESSLASLDYDGTDWSISGGNVGIGVTPSAKIHAVEDNIAATSTDGLILENTTASTAVQEQWSPRIRLSGSGYRSSATAESKTLDWILENKTINGALTGDGYLTFSYQTGNVPGYHEKFVLEGTGASGEGLVARLKGDNADLWFEDDDGTDRFSIDVRNNDVRLQTWNSKPLLINTAGNDVQIGGSSNLGIGQTPTADLHLNADATTTNAVQIEADTVTTGNVIDVANADALTTGSIMDLVSNSADTGTRSLVKIHNDNAAAVNATALEIVQDSTGNAITTDGNVASDTFEATGAYTVAGLPAGTVGQIARITDGDAALAHGATAVNSGAGATPYLVWFNGANWTVIGS